MLAERATEGDRVLLDSLSIDEKPSKMVGAEECKEISLGTGKPGVQAPPLLLSSWAAHGMGLCFSAVAP